METCKQFQYFKLTRVHSMSYLQPSASASTEVEDLLLMPWTVRDYIVLYLHLGVIVIVTVREMRRVDL